MTTPQEPNEAVVEHTVVPTVGQPPTDMKQAMEDAQNLQQDMFNGFQAEIGRANGQLIVERAERAAERRQWAREREALIKELASLRETLEAVAEAPKSADEPSSQESSEPEPAANGSGGKQRGKEVVTQSSPGGKSQ